MSYAELVTQIDRAAQGHLGGVTAIYRPEFGAEVPVVGMFDENFLLTSGDGSSVENVGPAIFVKLADLPVDFHEDEEARIVIGPTEYSFRGRETDGNQGGGVLLLLHRVP